MQIKTTPNFANNVTGTQDPLTSRGNKTRMTVIIPKQTFVAFKVWTTLKGLNLSEGFQLLFEQKK